MVVLQADHFPGVQRVPGAFQDGDVGEAPHLHQLDVRVLQDHDSASGGQVSCSRYTLCHTVHKQMP